MARVRHDGAIEPWFPREVLPGWASQVIEMMGGEVAPAERLAKHEGRPVLRAIHGVAMTASEWR
jgi:hypothetical protein